MLLEKEAIEGKTPEQIQEAYEAAYTVKETELTALANKNADGILDGFATKLNSVTGIARNGTDEKVSSYFERLTTEYLPEASKGKIEAAEEKVRVAEEKFKNHKGDETFKIELEKAQTELEKIPDLLAAKETEFKTKYETLETTYKSEKLNRSIIDSMPKFDDNVNKFELEAKKKNAIDRISEAYELSYDDKGNLIGTKDYKANLVSDLLKNDTELKELILTDQGAGGGGAGGGSGSTKVVNIPEGTSKGAAQNLIEAYIVANEGMDQLDDKYPERFKELCKENNVL